MAEQIAIASLPATLPAVHDKPAQAVDAQTDIEQRMIAHARNGDLAAFDWLTATYRDRALRLAAHVLRRPVEAEDVVQESFLRAFSQIRSFRSDCAFYTWFYRIVVRLCLNRMRSPEWRFRAARDVDGTVGIGKQSTPGPNETRALVETLLDQLSPPLRATLVLREVSGLEYEEIAQALDIPVGTVRSRLNAARNQFRILWLQVQEETRNA